MEPVAAGGRSAVHRTGAVPAPPTDWVDDLAERNVAAIQEVIATARNLRSELKVDPKRPSMQAFTALIRICSH